MSHAQYDPTPKAPPPLAQPAPAQGPGFARLLPVLGVVLGLLGLGMGAAAWFRAAPADVAGQPAYTEQQVSEAKEAVCSAYARGVQSFQIAGTKKVDNHSEALAIAVNTRLAEVAVGNYLINTLNAHPAAPYELRELIKKLAKSYQEIALKQLAESSDYKQLGLDADEAISKIEQVCP